MERDMDLVRELLLKLEGLPMRQGGILLIKPDDQELQIEGYDASQIDYHLTLMKKSGWIDTGGVNPMVGMGFRALTPAGHDLLDSLRSSLHTEIGTQSTTTMKLARSSQDLERGICRLQERIDALKAFDFQILENGSMPELAALSAAIADTLERHFGKDTTAYRRYKPATALRPVQPESYGNKFYLRQEAQENFQRSVALLQDAQRALREDLEDVEHAASQPVMTSTPLSRRVFVVHGHDDGAREAVARFLEKIGFEAIILHEQANQGRTVIEKIEAHGEVHFAVVLLTPDDTGCAKGGEPEPRARQNVLLELGYFIGRLGRERVFALKRGTLEIPSDFAGVVWEKMEDSGGWKQALGRELQAAGHEVDWNRVMRP